MEQKKEDQSFYKDLVDNLYDGVYFVDRDRKITYWNQGAERLSGYSGIEVIGFSCSQNILNHVSLDGELLCKKGCPLAACMEDGNTREAEVYMLHAAGHRVPVLVRAAPMKDEEGNIIGAVETFSKQSPSRISLKEMDDLRHKANTDSLTGLRNRHYLEAVLTNLVADSSQGTFDAAVLFFDIDHFKEVNDTYGHDTGDKVLQTVARTATNTLRATDVVGRWGGDEFMIILSDVPSANALKRIADKLKMLIEFSRTGLEAGDISVTISIGGTLFQKGDSIDSLLKRADAAMYRSKQKGRNTATVE